LSILHLAILAATCALTQQSSYDCINHPAPPPTSVNGTQSSAPISTGESTDVVLSAESALVWDIDTGDILYELNTNDRRPIASLNKLLSVLVIRDNLALDKTIEIPKEVQQAQRYGAHIGLKKGQHATVRDLLSASLIASANDAIVSLAVGMSGSEEKFVAQANIFSGQQGLGQTHLANSTGFSGDTQYSTANDVRKLLTMAYQDDTLRPFLSQPSGVLITEEGKRHAYKSTNKLLKTYVPIIAGKTGYTKEAGQNLAIITESSQGNRIGAVVLGSDDRFQDMKVLVEWTWRNYTWE